MIDRNLLGIVPLDDQRLEWASRLSEREWGGPLVVSRGRLIDATRLPGFVALVDGIPMGLATYLLEDGQCKLVILKSLASGQGLGTLLVTAVKEFAVAAACRRLWLITTNDNTPALRFYQQRGFLLAALHRNALALSRQLKPHIPQIGLYGIPLRDDIELEMILKNDD